MASTSSSINLLTNILPTQPSILPTQVYEHVTKRVAASQPPERQSHLAACLERVMAGVTRSLEPKNCDKFTQNFTIARHDYRART